MTLTKRICPGTWLLLTALLMASASTAAQAPTVDLDTPREAFLSCVKNSTTLLLQVDGANPPGIAYLTGLACYYQRDTYQKGLAAAAFPHVDLMMNRIDVAVVLYERDAWAARQSKAASH